MNERANSPCYPLAEKRPNLLRTPSGLRFEDITLEAVLDGRVRMEDLRVTAEALELQAQIAESVGRTQLAENFRRAAELVAIPDEHILQIYAALRPGRTSRAEILRLSQELERTYHATRCARFLREAAEVYSETGLEHRE